MRREPQETPAAGPLWRRVGWLVLIWVASVATLGVFAWLMRLFMSAAGLTTH
ncbi:DUF2474 domain-containing protein [Pseudomonas sp.]|uniref:DUF2474 domain-containing protein n=1 Tax=Pseudomonas sp. TaxID=306 RepID=UPI0028ADBBA9|nr:DUF2474 domain-containing protein [Pseudomonas sp.]